MKRPLLVKLAAVLVTVVAVVVIWFYVIPGQGKQSLSMVNPAFAEFISSYSGGVLSSGSTVRIVFAHDVVDSTAVGQTESRTLFEFVPKMNGKTRWLDRRTIEFVPDGRWPSGKQVEGRFRLNRIMTVPDDLAFFIWNFQIMSQYIDLTVENVVPYVKTEIARLKIEGQVETADYAESSGVEKSLRATQDGKELTITWQHSAEGRQHHFTIEEVARKETAGKVLIQLDGTAAGVNTKLEREVEIPSLSDFKVTQVYVAQGTSQHVVIRFSDPLNESQNLFGLIWLSGAGSPEYQIEQNTVRLYPSTRQTGTTTLTIEAGIRNVFNHRLSNSSTYTITFEELKPAVRFTGNGTILPNSEGLILPFEAVNLKSVDVQVIRIFERNILQFLQINEMSGNQELRRVGKPVLKKTISLENAGVTDLGRWNRFTLDLASLIRPEPGAIYQVQISFRKSYSAYTCKEPLATEEKINAFEETDWDDEGEYSYWDSYETYDYEDYDWRERDNPCHSSYYSGSRNIRKNILASDLGIIAKRGGDGNTVVVVTDLKTTQPLSGVTVELYNFQQQLIGTGTTGADGKTIVQTTATPFALIARQGAQRGYLKLSEAASLSLSAFDVSGQQVEKALKGYLYGERGVWRPGDSIYMTFVLEDKLKQLPAAHPVIMELQNPAGQVVQRMVRTTSENGFYSFATATAADAPTGTWTARVKAGGAEFRQPLKIETVKPNRLKINLSFGTDKIKAPDTRLNGTLMVNWLHGAPGRNLQAQFEVLLNQGSLSFPKYPAYQFNDPSQAYYPEVQQIFDGFTDSEGKASFQSQLEISSNPPALISAVFRGRVYEESGNFSVDQFTIPVFPYTSYVGLRLPEGDKARNMLLTDTTHKVDVVTVDAEGNPVSREQIRVSLYKLTWSWWWDNTDNSAVYRAFSQAREISTGVIQTRNGKGSWSFKVKYPDWGRYLVRVTDEVSGHSASQVVYIDWPGWAGRARPGADGATMLSFSTDKSQYQIGEKATVVIPGSAPGRALVSIENGSRVLETHWVETRQGDTPFQFNITSDMSPNIYVHITLVQPHSQTVNDSPIRLYGVVPVMVEDPKTRLEPVIEMSNELEPGQEVVIRVSEKANRTMTYTLAVVDEGLLDITRFKTPDLWSRFYAREALGVRTWDMYNEVIGSFGGQIERLLAIGGDGELSLRAKEDSETNRFRPVVKYFKPVTLRGGKQEHRFRMPNYVGSVRIMVVGGYAGAYGSAEKTVPVRKPLMVLATLPRVLGPEEKVKLPVTLFTTDKNIRQVKVEVRAKGPVQLKQPIQTVNMSRADMTIDFDVEVLAATGKATFEVTASSGSEKASDMIHIDIRNPNVPVTKVYDAVVDAGKSQNLTYKPVGMPGTNRVTLEVSSLPPLNLGHRLQYLIQYPYGCLEQTVSAAFPQLYLSEVKELTADERATVQRHIMAAIDRVKSFQNREGGFVLWPGGEDTDSWTTSYAGHFLIEAERKGYPVPQDVMNKWKRFQRNRAQAWRKTEEAFSSELIQAYRLYTLTASGNTDLSSMNRLREQVNQPVARWMLAAAYAKAGQPEAARNLIDNQPVNFTPYQEQAWSYGSDLRDKAIVLETYNLLNDRTKAFELVKEISDVLSNSDYYLSTQATAWCIKSVSQFAAGERSSQLKFTYVFGEKGKEKEVETKLPYAELMLPSADAASSLQLKNTSSSTLFVRLISLGTPARGNETEESRNLSLSVEYMDLQGRPLDITRLEQGTQFVASVTIGNLRRNALKNIALSQVFPSGWEITNLRLDEAESRAGGDRPNYQDIRDDRVYTHFDLNAGERKNFRVLLTASYAGTYYLPAVVCEAMYDQTVYARKKGYVVDVVKPMLP
ncbi:MAG: MG2 domain-containing protein [Cyclobacteriaceae bacterium]|nr:MG2 domain-containing protein [Cyclobacteriaceae bacterium]